MGHKLLIDLDIENFENIIKESTKETIKRKKRVSYARTINEVLARYFKSKDRTGLEYTDINRKRSRCYKKSSYLRSSNTHITI
ncbi:MAG: hypothetical protein Unbinned7913contig1002_57 [Prokaryotic dsDNA virus sp.]|jgi:hypothetical protein|nr:MAG: hypothetical protein Unbinned7913contig1002_57 [Prokaryotic dsDNA virus sp.]|tara:strand:+ start:65 stop:313 length:249 start_codon:yes stop_codon:yes gene_type:complete